jgi:hypothetical protein
MPTISSLSLAGANLPRSASADAARILVARGLRAFGDGFVALLVPIYLVELGFSAWAIGTIVTSTLMAQPSRRYGSGWSPIAIPCGCLLIAAALLMAATGAGFATDDRVLAAVFDRLCRDGKPDFRRRQHLFAARTGGVDPGGRAAPHRGEPHGGSQDLCLEH